ncbi:hypothetical protein D9M69_683220 [compost metagenome]
MPGTLLVVAHLIEEQGGNENQQHHHGRDGQAADAADQHQLGLLEPDGTDQHDDPQNDSGHGQDGCQPQIVQVQLENEECAQHRHDEHAEQVVRFQQRGLGVLAERMSGPL